jgi:hypothetical protein
MAGEDARYTKWVRAQPCAACGGPGPSEPHHALSGTTYSPDEARPAKAIPNARKGKAQRAHDHFAIPLHTRCHAQFHRGTGMFSEMSPEQRDAWEQREVREHRNRYAMQCPVPVIVGETSAKPHRRRANAGDAAHRERLRIASWLRDRAGARHFKVNEAAVLTDAASEIEAMGGSDF